MNSDNYWTTMHSILDGVSEIRERVARIEGALPSLATREQVSEIFDAKISQHSTACRASRSSKTSIIPKPTDWNPAVKAVSKVLLALAGLIAAATAAWFAAR